MEPQFRTKRGPGRAGRKGSPCRDRSVYPDASDPELSLLTDSYLQEFKPRNDEEHAAVGTMVRAEWQTRCLWKLEDELFMAKMRELHPLHPGAGSRTLLTLTVRALSEEGGPLHEINAQSDQYEAEYLRAWKRLKQLRAKK